MRSIYFFSFMLLGFGAGAQDIKQIDKAKHVNNITPVEQSAKNNEPPKALPSGHPHMIARHRPQLGDPQRSPKRTSVNESPGKKAQGDLVR